MLGSPLGVLQLFTALAIHFKTDAMSVIATGRYDHVFCQRLHADLQTFTVMGIEVNTDR